MATSLLTLLDDIASLLDDVAALTKVAAKKTTGVLGDDLALNAEKVTGVRAERELPVVWAVAKGSALNKLILVPSALLISAFLPWLVPVLLMIGGVYLCYEGAEKIVHRYLESRSTDVEVRKKRVAAVADASVDMVAFEKERIRGAIRTDFILSAEIIVISLGVVADAALPTRIGVLAGIAVAMTVGVYGLVAVIVKMDDVGLALSRRPGVQALIGRGLLAVAPWVMKFLSIAGTVAMFLVGGGILSHNVGLLHHASESFAAMVPGVGTVLFDALVGLAAGFIVLGVVLLVRRMLPGSAPAAGH
jgi:predicted DNA repair protein MutK